MATATLELAAPAVAFEFSEEVVRIFTEGDCWMLAHEIAAVSSLPMVAYADDELGAWCHVGNRLPDGRIVDIEGIWEETQWVQKWSCVPYWSEWEEETGDQTKPQVTVWNEVDFQFQVIGAYVSPQFVEFKDARVTANEIVNFLTD